MTSYSSRSSATDKCTDAHAHAHAVALFTYRCELLNDTQHHQILYRFDILCHRDAMCHDPLQYGFGMCMEREGTKFDLTQLVQGACIGGDEFEQARCEETCACA